MRGATVPGRLNLNGASLPNRGGVVLRAGTCTIGELWLENAAPITGLVTLRRSRIDLIHAPHKVGRPTSGWTG